MDLEDIPVPPTPPSSSTGIASTTKEDGDGNNPANEAWRKAQEALQHIQGDGSGKHQKSMADYSAAGGAYNPYLQSYPWYPNYPSADNAGNYPPWMQSAYAAWGQQSQTTGSYQRFGYNSASTQSNASLPSSSPSGSFSEQSSSESVTPATNFRGTYRQQAPARALLGDRPTRPGLGYGNRGGGGPVRFGIRRGAIGSNQPRFVAETKSSMGFAEDRSGVESGGWNDESASQKEMPKSMEAYVERAFAAAESAEQKTQVEQALKQHLLPLLHSGEAYTMDWDNEPLPTETRFVVRLLQTSMKTRGRGGSPAASRLLSNRGGVRGGFLGGIPKPDQSQPVFGVGNTHEQYQQQQNNLDTQRGRGGFTLRGRGHRGGFSGRQPLLFRSDSKSSGSGDERNVKDESGSNRRRRRDSSTSDETPKKRGRGPSNGRRSSTSSHESGTFNGKRGGGKKDKWAAMKKKKQNKKAQKKRYSTEDLDNDDHESDDNQNQSTAGKAGKKQKKNAAKFTLDKHVSKSEQEAMKRQRAMRFAEHMNQQSTKKPAKSLASRLGKRRGRDDSDLFMDDRSNASPDSGAFDYEFDPTAFLIIGTCEVLEKPYLRLTTMPDPSQVRPEPVLVKALAMVKQKWKERADYRYVCDQLKSIRQDMTIQCIRNRFSVDVYETHARIALEKADREEFNQCQSQLKALYGELPGCPNEYEFTAYRLLFYVYMENTMDITTILAHLTPEMHKDECIRFALKVRRAWSLKNYSSFFKLACSGRPPRMCTYVLELFMDRERKRALKTMLKAYRPTLPISYISETLSFESVDDCSEYLRQLQIPFAEEDDSKVDCRQTIPAF